MDSITDEERVNKPYFVNDKKIFDRREKDRLRISKLCRSRPFIRFQKKLEKELKQKYEQDKDNQVLELRKKLQKRREELTEQLKQQSINEGKNVNHGSTWKSLILWRERMLTEEFGFLPENIENCSLAQAKRLLWPKYPKEEQPINEDWIFEIPDEDLDAIAKMAKHDPVKWFATMQRIDEYRQAKRAGRIGMYRDQKGEFQT